MRCSPPTRPERISALILYATAAGRTQAHDYPWQWSEPEWAEYLDGVQAGWGTRQFAVEVLALFGPSLAGYERMEAWFERFLRASAGPSAIYAQEQVFRNMDVRRLLPAIGVPTLVLHRADDAIEPVGAGRCLAHEIVGATYVELSGGDHFPWAGDQGPLIAQVERFVRGAWREEQETFDTVLATILSPT